MLKFVSMSKNRHKNVDFVLKLVSMSKNRHKNVDFVLKLPPKSQNGHKNVGLWTELWTKFFLYQVGYGNKLLILIYNKIKLIKLSCPIGEMLSQV